LLCLACARSTRATCCKVENNRSSRGVWSTFLPAAWVARMGAEEIWSGRSACRRWWGELKYSCELRHDQVGAGGESKQSERVKRATRSTFGFGLLLSRPPMSRSIWAARAGRRAACRADGECLYRGGRDNRRELAGFELDVTKGNRDRSRHGAGVVWPRRVESVCIFRAARPARACRGWEIRWKDIFVSAFPCETKATQLWAVEPSHAFILFPAEDIHSVRFSYYIF
jgi:hypothetical protein